MSLFTGSSCVTRQLQGRTEPGFGAQTIADPSSFVVLLHNSRPLVHRQQGGAGVLLARVPAAAFHAAFPLDIAASPASAGALPAVVAGRLEATPEAGAGAGTTMVGVDVTSLGADAAAVAAQIATALPAIQSEATGALAFVDPREVLVAGLAGTGVQPLTPLPDAVSTPAQLMAALDPSAIAWPLSFHEAMLFATVRGLLLWHSKSRFCGCCGSPLVPVDGGVKKTCAGTSPAAPGCKETVYPRTDPVAISVVQSKDGSRILLGRQPAFPPGYFSCLAGFLETGECVEEGVRREVLEEAGVKLGPVKYHSSQPWPLGRGMYNQLMLGCIATAESGDTDADLRVDTAELAEARWFSREEVVAALEWHYRGPASSGSEGGSSGGRASSPSGPRHAPRLKVPGPFALAHQLMRAWVAGEGKALL